MRSPVTVCVIVSAAISLMSPPVLVISAVSTMSSAELSRMSPPAVVTVASRRMPLSRVVVGGREEHGAGPAGGQDVVDIDVVGRDE